MHVLYGIAGGIVIGIVVDRFFVGRLVTALSTELFGLEHRLKDYIDSKLK